MKFGLTDSEYDFLSTHLIKPLKDFNAQVFIFGSRANMKNHKFSDIDILYTENPIKLIPNTTISQILIFFEESKFPYKIDLVNSKNLARSYADHVHLEKIEV